MYTMCFDQVYPLYSVQFFSIHFPPFLPNFKWSCCSNPESTQNFQYVGGITLSAGAQAASHMLFVFVSLICFFYFILLI